MKKVLLFSVLAGLLTPFTQVHSETIRISGSNTLGAKLIPRCAKSYLSHIGGFSPVIKTVAENEFLVSAKNSDVEFSIKAHGSSTGFRAVKAGEASIAMSSRPIKSKEVTALAHTGDMTSEDAEHTVAVDGLAVLVHPANPVKQLTISQIADIFSGEIRNWAEVGGQDLPISIYARDKNSGTWDTFKNLVLRKQYQLRGDAQRFESNDKLSDSVAGDISGIGFAGLASVRKAKPLQVSDDQTTAVAPSRLSVATEDYPLTRRLYVYTPPSLKDDRISNFVEYCQSQQGQNIVEQVGFISQNIIAVPQAATDNAPQEYQQLSSHAERLSVNFRFRPGSAQLDNKAKRDLQRLTDYLRQPDNKQRPVYLVGFNDQGKSDVRADLLAKFRALAVWSELFKEDVLIYRAMSFGAFMPVASNSNAVSKMKNSRVEIWIDKQALQGLATQCTQPCGESPANNEA